MSLRKTSTVNKVLKQQEEQQRTKHNVKLTPFRKRHETMRTEGPKIGLETPAVEKHKSVCFRSDQQPWKKVHPDRKIRAFNNLNTVCSNHLCSSCLKKLRSLHFSQGTPQSRKKNEIDLGNRSEAR